MDDYEYNLDLIFGAFAIIPTKDDEKTFSLFK